MPRPRQVADVVGLRQCRRAVVGGGERVVAAAQVVRGHLGLPGAREDAFAIAADAGICLCSLEVCKVPNKLSYEETCLTQLVKRLKVL